MKHNLASEVSVNKFELAGVFLDGIIIIVNKDFKRK